MKNKNRVPINLLFKYCNNFSFKLINIRKCLFELARCTRIFTKKMWWRNDYWGKNKISFCSHCFINFKDQLFLLAYHYRQLVQTVNLCSQLTLEFYWNWEDIWNVESMYFFIAFIVKRNCGVFRLRIKHMSFYVLRIESHVMFYILFPLWQNENYLKYRI